MRCMDKSIIVNLCCHSDRPGEYYRSHQQCACQ